MSDEISQAEKPKLTRGIMAALPPHAQDEMREANRELGMALEVVRGIVDAHVAGTLPPGKVIELVTAKRRRDDEAALARRKPSLTSGGVFSVARGALEREIVELAALPKRTGDAS